MTEPPAPVPTPVPAAGLLVLFDWNGTLVLDTARARDALNDVLRARGLAALSPGDFAIRFRLPMAEMFAALGVRRSEAADAESEWNAAVARRVARPRDGLVEGLGQLASRGATLGIVSAAAAQVIETDLLRIGVPTPFATIDTAVPDKARALRARRGTAQRAYYVGDTVHDIHSALVTGYVPIGVADGYTGVSRLVAAGATAIVGDLRELIGLIFRDPGGAAEGGAAR
ncbi:HAD family hydrolase [Acrocarpospora macrocephala]|nr:HAD hydrolase-like protein [Acrocarpospora macrocephala]